MRVGVVIPALNEEGCIAEAIGDCLRNIRPDDEARVVVCDNNSTDDTVAAARKAGAEVVREQHRGYGAACLRGIEHLGDWPEVLLFVDGDGSSDCDSTSALLDPIRRGQADLVIGWRRFPERGSMSPPQRFGSWLFSRMVNLRWGGQCHDLGPFRAITADALKTLAMSDLTWGWTIEMQIKAILNGLRVAEVPVGWRCRRSGTSKISGTVSGVIRAAAKISSTFARYALCSAKPLRQPRDTVIAFAKYPTPGSVKTRLAAEVGDVQAAMIYRRLAERCCRQLNKLQASGTADVVICGKGATMATFRSWLPGARHYRPQPPGDLTHILQAAFEKAYRGGARRVAAVGTDSPGLTADMINKALGELRQADVAIVPNTDGGYALIATNSYQPKLFEDIDWSTPAVLKQTRKLAAELGLRVSELPAIPDIDTADDLKHLPPLLSIVMPVLNEEKILRINLPKVTRQMASMDHTVELILVDGGSTDDSVAVGLEFGATLVSSGRGRGRQLNAGTAVARGDWLWYLHADCLIQDGTIAHVLETIQRNPCRSWGYCRARINAPGLALRIIECGIRLRSRLLTLPYGDQGLFVHRETMQDLGGFVESELLEDVDLVMRLGQAGPPIRISCPLLIDARRWRQYGTWRTTMINWSIMFDYRIKGHDIREIARRYRVNNQPAPSAGVEFQEGAVY